MKRLKLAFAFMMLLILALMGYMMQKNADLVTKKDHSPPEAMPEADISLKEPRFIEMKGARVVLEVNAGEANYFREGDAAELSKPRMVFRGEKGRRSVVEGDKGIINTVSNDMTMDGHVRGTTWDGYYFESSSVNYVHSENTVTSRGRIKITGRGMMLKGIGMKADMDRGRYYIYREVEAFLDPSFRNVSSAPVD